MARKPPSRKRSLVLITVDCLRADHCGFNGYSRPTTPFLDSLAAESFVVPAAIVAGAPTYFSLPAILASRMPLALGRDVVGLAPGENTLATRLRDSGYATAAFSAANPYISPRFGYDQGFEVFRDFLDFEAPSTQEATDTASSPRDSIRTKLNRAARSCGRALGLSRIYDELYFQYRMKILPPIGNVDNLRKFPAAHCLVEQARSWLASIGDRPFFLWLHMMDPHSPYYPSNDAFLELTGRDINPGSARYLNEYWNRSDLRPVDFIGKRDEVMSLYDAGVRSVDRQIARLVDSLKETGSWDDCVFALTADHGEEFLEHGARYHAPLGMNEEIIHVPLLMRVPGERGAQVPSCPMSHLHLAPTLLDIVGESAPPSFRGRSLWPNLQMGNAWDDVAIVESTYGCTNPFQAETRNAPRLLAIRDSRFKLVLRLAPGDTEEVYDLELDPTETHPFVASSAATLPGSETRKRLLEIAREHLKQSVSTRDSDMRLRARLRDLRSEMLEA